MPRYQPTDKDRWNQQQRAAADARKRAESAQREADKLRAQMAKDELAAQEKRRKIAADAEKAADAEAAAEEKAILTAPKTKYIGATKKNPNAILVWHHGVEVPEEMRGPHARAGIGPLLALRPGGGQYIPEDAAVLAIRHRHPDVDEQFPEFIKAHKAALKEARTGYPILNVLRDDKKMARLFGAAGLNMESKTTETMTGTYGVYSRSVTAIHVPELVDVVVRASGLELTYRHRLGDSAKNWNSKLDPLRSAFRSLGVDPSQMTVSESASGDIVVRLHDRDPFDSISSMETGTWDDDRFRSLLGIDSNGREVWIVWKNVSGMVVGGVSGSGKTASMLPVFRQFENNAELYIFDGKAQRDLHPLRHIARVYDNSGDIAAPLATLEMLEKLRVLRGDALYEKLAAANFWHLSSAQRRQLRMKPIFVILDEAQVWMKQSTNKDKARIQARILECVENLIRMGRSAGIVVIITTQRPSAVSIPTDVRDNAQLKLSFRVTNDTMTQMVLGDIPKGQLNPASIPISALGRFVMDTEGVGMVLGQAGYISPSDLEDALKDAEPVPDQWTVAEAFSGGLREGMARPESAPAAPSQDDDQAPATPTAQAAPGHGPDGAVGNGQVDDRAQRREAVDDAQLLSALVEAVQRTPRAFSDDELDALAEAQRRGLIPKPEEPAEPAPKTAPPQQQPAKPVQPQTTGFDF